MSIKSSPTTQVETILSPQSTSSSSIHGMPMDELYDERRSLRMEWIRFMDSMDSCDDDATTSTAGEKNDKYAAMDGTGDVELWYPPTTNSNNCPLDSIFSGAKNDFVDECRDEHNGNNDDGNVLDTFRSLKAQVDHLDGILEEFTDLPKSPATKASSRTVLEEKPIEQSTNVTRFTARSATNSTFKRGLYDECDTFEDEWDALDKLEMELRQELKSFGMKLANKNYEKENSSWDNEEISQQDSCPELIDEQEIAHPEEEQTKMSQSKSPINTNAIEYHNELKENIPNKCDDEAEERVEEENSSSEHEEQNNCPELMDEVEDEVTEQIFVENEEHHQLQIQPKLPVDPIECIYELQERAANNQDDEQVEHAADKNESTTTTITKRDCTPAILEVSTLVSQDTEEESATSMFMNCVSCTPRACSDACDDDKDEYWDPIAAQRIRYDPSILLSSESLLPDREKVLSPIYETNVERNEFLSPISALSSFTMEDHEILNSSEKEPMVSNIQAILLPSSSKAMVPALEASTNEKKDMFDYPFNVTEMVTSFESKPFGCKRANRDEKEKPKTTSPPKATSYSMMVPTDVNEKLGKLERSTSWKQENLVDEMNDCECRDELNHANSDILVVPTKSASTLTREEAPSSDTLDSHDEMLNEILLEDETLTQHSKSLNSTCAEDTGGLEQNVLEDILSEQDETLTQHSKSQDSSCADDTELSEHKVLEDILSERDDESDGDRSILDVTTDKNPYDPVENPTPMSPFREHPTKTPANHQRSKTINNFDHIRSVDKSGKCGAEIKSPFFRVQKTPVRSPLSTTKGTPFMSPYMAFELDAFSDGSVDLITISESVDRVSPTKREIRGSGQGLVRKEPLSMPSAIKELSLLDSESDGDYVSPLTSPIMFEDPKAGNPEANDLVGQICAKVGNVLVLDQGEQSNIAPELPIIRNEIPVEAFNGIETILAEKSNDAEPDSVKEEKEGLNALQFNISEIDSNESTENHISPDASSKQACKMAKTEVDSHNATISLETKILMLNQQLLNSIVSRDFVAYSNLTIENISGIDWQGEILHGQSVNWKAEQLLRTPYGMEDGKKHSLLENNISLEQCSIQQLSQDVVIAICTFSESLTRNCFRETRIWKETNKGEWKNCHLHRHCSFSQ